MAVIGTYGDVVFSVSQKTINTFNNMKWSSSVRYATHNRHLKIPLKEFLGVKEETITFDMNFSVFDGVNPIKEVAKLLIMMRNGTSSNLIIGTKAYGRGEWVITKLDTDLENFDNKGNLLVAKMKISLSENARR